MDQEAVVKIEGYSVEDDKGHARKDEIKSVKSASPVPLLPGPCDLKNYNLKSTTAQVGKKYKCSIPNCSERFASKSLKSFKNCRNHRTQEREVHSVTRETAKKYRSKKQPTHQCSNKPAKAATAPLLKANNPTNKCDVCLKIFKSSRALGRHRRQVHAAENEKRFKCHICPKSFVIRPRLKIHLYFVHGEKIENLKIFKCEFCQRQFPRVSSLETHIVDKHVVDKEFECSACSKTFVDQEALTKHQVKIHKQQRTINHFCHVCSAGCESLRKLVCHLKVVHQKYVHCYKCGRSFTNKSEFNQHLISEATHKLKAGLELKCQVCSVLLSTQCNFNIHADGHLKENKSTVVA